MNQLYKDNPALMDSYIKMNNEITGEIKRLRSARTSQGTSVDVEYKIPVVVHVIHNVSSGALTGLNISDEKIFSQIAILNKDFSRTNDDTADTYLPFKPIAADTKISFCLASIDPDGNPTTGIVRVYNTKGSYSTGEESRLKALSYWPSDEYLNIWICSIADGFLGYAQFPNNSSLPGLSPNMGANETDGLVLDYRYVGDINSTAPYDKGRTATHEIGHWLGLLHIWGDDTCATDFIADTPTQRYANLNNISCTMNYSSCPSTAPSTLDMSQNYMDYSADACLNMFTINQKERMHAVMQVSPRRAALVNSIGCCPVEKRVTIPFKETVENDTYLTDGWLVTNPDYMSAFSTKWERTNMGAYGRSSGSFMIKNDSVYSSSMPNYWDAIETLYIDMSTMARPVMDFDLAYARNLLNQNTDSLVIYYTEACNGNYIPLKVLYGSDLTTTTRETGDFVPTAEEWKKIKLDLTHLSGKKYIKIRFAVYSKGVNKLYIDNINFYKESDGFYMYLYPTPVDEVLTIEMAYEGYKDITLEAFSLLGKRVLKREFFDTPSFIDAIDVSLLESGIYIFKVSSGKQVVPRRVVIF